MVRILMLIGLTTIASFSAWQNDIREGQVSKIQMSSVVVQCHREVRNVLAAQEGPADSFTLGHRLVAVSLFILLAPVLTAPLANSVLDRRSNTGNLLLLFGYTGLDMLVVHVVGGFSVGGIVSAIAYMIGLLAVFSYNLWICAFLARLRR